jgi:hypothetical protein
MSNPRIPNYQIDNRVTGFAPFENYNGTISGRYQGATYVVRHWGTDVLVYNMRANCIDGLAEDYISQTTSTLIGRLLRNLPRHAVDHYLTDRAHPGNMKRLTRMVGQL